MISWKIFLLYSTLRQYLLLEDHISIWKRLEVGGKEGMKREILPHQWLTTSCQPGRKEFSLILKIWSPAQQQNTLILDYSQIQFDLPLGNDNIHYNCRDSEANTRVVQYLSTKYYNLSDLDGFVLNKQKWFPWNPSKYMSGQAK